MLKSYVNRKQVLFVPSISATCSGRTDHRLALTFKNRGSYI